MDSLCNLVTEAGKTLAKLAGDYTVKQLKYMIYHNKIMADLLEEHKKLKCMKTTWQNKVDAHKRNGLEIAANVQEWLGKVEDIDNDLQAFYEYEDKKSFGGLCPNLAANYSLGKQATQKAQVIASLKEAEKELKVVAYPKAPRRLGSLFTDDIKELESRKAIVQEFMEKLKDEGLKRLSICGMSGVGKTTLVKQVIENAEESKLFDEYVMVVVSQNPDYSNIQVQIADRLGLKFKGESMQGRAAELHDRVNGDKRVLIVLDDVWKELVFEDIGLPSLKHQKRSKIIFTSRNQRVCENMGSRYNKNVGVLFEDEAWDLFRDMADGVKKRDLHDIAKQVAKECGGLPLALVTVARALRSEGKYVWEDALERLRDPPSSSLSEMQESIYTPIEVSFNFLRSEEEKRCLMLCGLFPEDFDIPVESILRHGLGLGIFQIKGELWKARNRVHTVIGQLKRCFLLLESDKAECVKMHDVVRDVVLSIACTPQHGLMVQHNAELKSPKEGNLDDVKAISFILNDTKGLSLQLLQVRSKSKEPNPWPQHVLRGITSKLKVLSITNLYIPILSSSLLQTSANLHTLQLEYCDIRDISIIGKQLKKLQILSFAYSNIKELPVEIGELSLLKLLDLTQCNDLYFFSTNVLRRLSKLEELYLRVENFPRIDNKDVLLELQNLSNHLKVIELKVTKIETLPTNFSFESLEKFWIYVATSEIFKRGGYLESNILEIQSANYKSIKSNLLVNDLVRKCEILLLEKVKGMKNFIYELDGREHLFSSLKVLKVDSCPDLEYFIDGIGPNNPIAQIQKLSLSNLENLREICNASDDNNMEELMIHFSNLLELTLQYLPNLTGFSKATDSDKAIQLIHCESELVNVNESSGRSNPEPSRKLFSTKWIHQFPKLETLSIKSCESLEMVFDLKGYSQLNGSSSIALIFPQLEQINILSLSNLTHVWGNASNYVQGFQNLTSLEISECHSLRHAFTVAIVRAISKLEKLMVSSCELMAHLVVDDNRDEEEKGEMKIVFGRLRFLCLFDLSNMESICPKSYELELPSVRNLEIEDCPKLNISSLLTQERHSRHINVIAKSNFNNLKENHSTNFGCFPLFSKLFRQEGNINNNRTTKMQSLLLPYLEELQVDNCELHDEMCEKTRIPIIYSHLFPKLTSLTVVYCNKIIMLLSLSLMTSFESLKKLQVVDCEDIEEIISSEQETEQVMSSNNKIAFPRLQTLELENLRNLKVFYNGSYLFDFPSLINVGIKNCPNMELFSRGSSLTPQLQFLEMRGQYCKNSTHSQCDLNTAIQGFRTLEGLYDSAMLISLEDIKMLQHVKQLWLEGYKSLVEVFETKDGMIATKNTFGIEIVVLRDLPALRCIWGPNSMRSLLRFDNLAYIDISGCHSLKTLFFHSMAINLVHLESLIIRNCNIMEEIITIEGDNTDDRGSKVKTLFPKLETLFLSNLPKLESVCAGDYFGYDIPLLCNEEDNGINNKQQQRQEVQISFPQLSDLRLKEVPNLKCICGGAYDYEMLLSSSSSSSCVEKCSDIISSSTFPIPNVIVTTPNLHKIFGKIMMRTLGDLNLTLHCLYNSEKYKVELQKLETLSHIHEKPEYQHLLAYISRVTYLQLESCHNLFNCVPSNMMHSFRHLERLRVQQCDRLEEIFESNNDHEGVELWWMELCSLPKLKHIWRNDGPVSGFQNLNRLIIRACHDLKFVFPCVSVAKSLPNLFQLQVKDCKKMEEIIQNNNGDTCILKGDKIRFPALNNIELENLPTLTCFYPNSYHFELPTCHYLRIEECPKMETFCYGTLYTPDLWIRLSIEGKKFDGSRDVNEAIKEIRGGQQL